MWHLTFVVQGRLQGFLHEAELREAARTVARIVGARLLSWGFPGDHLHALMIGTRAEIGRLGRDLRLALRAAGVALNEPHFREVTGRNDLENVVAYHLRQARKHGACERPALFSGGCFLDLVGARILDGYDPAGLIARLPRFDIARHLDEVAVRGLPVAMPEAEIRGLGAARLIAASAATFAVGPDLSTNAPEVVAARRTAVALGVAAGVPRSELAFSLGFTVQGVGRLARLPREPRRELAVRLRLGLEAAAMAVARPPRKGDGR